MKMVAPVVGILFWLFGIGMALNNGSSKEKPKENKKSSETKKPDIDLELLKKIYDINCNNDSLPTKIGEELIPNYLFNLMPDYKPSEIGAELTPKELKTEIRDWKIDDLNKRRKEQKNLYKMLKTMERPTTVPIQGGGFFYTDNTIPGVWGGVLRDERGEIMKRNPVYKPPWML